MVFCAQCGNRCLEGARFCNACGAKLVEAASPAAATATAATTATGTAPAHMVCPTCKRVAGDLLDKIVGQQHYHLDCFVCNQCKQYLGERRFFRDPREAGMLLCADCKDLVVAAPATTRTTTGGGLEAGAGYAVRRPVIVPGATDCRRCGRAVYANEQFRACGGVWHAACFTCEACARRLDPRFFETAADRPYCRECFSAKKPC